MSSVASVTAALTGCILLASCAGSDGPTNPDPKAIASVSLSESAVTIESGFFTMVSATVTAVDGSILPTTVSWSTDNPAIATIAGGTVDAISIGSTTIRASAGGKAASLAVTVIPAHVASLRLSQSSAAFAPGRTFQVVAEPLDALDRPIAGRSITFSSSLESVATISSTGLVTTRNPGRADILAVAEGKSSTLKLVVDAPATVSVTAVGIPAVGFVFSNQYVMKIRHTDDSVSATLPLSTRTIVAGRMVLADTIQFVAAGNDAEVFSSSVVAEKGQMPASVPVVLIPRAVTIPSGNFAGSTVSIDLPAAFTPCPATNGQCGSGFFTPQMDYGVNSWRTFPINVVIEAPLDSARIWDALRALETSLGKKLFVPSGGTGIIEVTAGLPPGVTNVGGNAEWDVDQLGYITGGRIWFPGTLPRSIVQHEFLHTLGFLHTCAWLSVMGGWGCTQATEVTMQDVAYVRLASAVFDAENSLRLPNGLLPCGEMGIGAATRNRHVIVRCDGDAWIPYDDFLRSDRLTYTRVVDPSGTRHYFAQ